MLTLDNYPLAVDTDYNELSDFLYKYLPLFVFCPWLAPDTPTAGLAMLTTAIGQHPYREPRIGRFIWPTGASRFAYGHFYADSDTTQNIMDDAYNDDGSYNLLNFSIGNPEKNKSGTITAGETINTQVYLLPPTPLSGIRGLSASGEFAQQTPANSLYLLTLVDQRYFWWYYNVGNITAQLSSSTQWMDLFNLIFGILNIKAFTIDTISPSYLQPSQQMFSLPYEPIPPVLDAICENLGMRLCCNFDNSVNTQLYGTALTKLNTDMMNNPGRDISSGGQRLSNPM